MTNPEFYTQLNYWSNTRQVLMIEELKILTPIDSLYSMWEIWYPRIEQTKKKEDILLRIQENQHKRTVKGNLRMMALPEAEGRQLRQIGATWLKTHTRPKQLFPRCPGRPGSNPSLYLACLHYRLISFFLSTPVAWVSWGHPFHPQSVWPGPIPGSWKSLGQAYNCTLPLTIPGHLAPDSYCPTRPSSWSEFLGTRSMTLPTDFPAGALQASRR